MIDFIKDHAIVIILSLLAFVKVIVNLTPSDKDNKIFGLIDMLINALFSNRKKGGGKHPNK